MMSLETIKAMSAEQGDQAKLRGDQPVNFSKVEIETMKAGDLSLLKNIPNIGDYDPVYFKRIELDQIDDNDRGVYMGDNKGFGAYFVDASFCGSRNEPALAVQEFVERLNPKYAYAIVEEGQFQIKVGVFGYEA